MAVKSGFFNSVNGDRRYDATFFAEYFSSFIENGVFPDLESSLQVVENENMFIRILPGKGWINGYYVNNDDDYLLQHPNSDGTLDRIDRLVMRINYLERTIEFAIKQGKYASSPIAPGLQRDLDFYELALADVYIRAGATSIIQDNITDLRDNPFFCGWATAKVVGWDRIKEEIYNWFEEVQSASYATTEEVRTADNDIKREVANLNLHLDASNRVTNGVTFGTNFDTMFGMEIDYTRNQSVNALNIGQTEITLEDASGFKIGHEVTIYDDINLERRRILNIVSNTLVVDSLSKGFKAGANIARSMILYDEVNKAMNFGSFGSLSVVTIDGENLPQPFSAKSLISLQQTIFYVDSNRQLNVRDDEGVWSRKTALQGSYFSSTTTDGEKYVYVFSETNYDANNRRTVYIHAYDEQGNLIKQKTLGSGPYWSNPSSQYFNKTLYYLIQAYGGAQELYKTTFDGVDFTAPVMIASGTWNKGGLIVLNDNEFVAFSYNATAATFNKIVGTTSTSHTFTQSGIIGGGVIDGKLTFISLNNNVVGIHQTENNSTWTTKTYTLGATPSKSIAVIDSEETIHLALLVDSNLYVTKKISIAVGFEELVRYGTVTGTSLAAPIAHNQKYRKPLMLLDNTKLMAELLVGEGSPLTINDVRFTTKPTTEAVAWIKHDEGLTITEGVFNDRIMDLTVVDDETQLVGIKFEDSVGEIRVTMERPTTEDDVRITRIIGGVE
jgi:hypothetical protein